MTRMHFTKDPDCVAACRDFVKQALCPRPVELVDRATLVASELVTNVIRHTSDGGSLELVVAPEQLRLEVSDFSTISPWNFRTTSPLFAARSTHRVFVVQ